MEYTYELFPQLDNVNVASHQNQPTYSPMMEISHNSSVSSSNHHRSDSNNGMLYSTEQDYYYYSQVSQQRMPHQPFGNTNSTGNNRANILDSEEILFPSTVHQQTYPVYNNQIITAASSSSTQNYSIAQSTFSPSSLCYTSNGESPLSNESDNFNQQQQHPTYYAYNSSIDMLVMTPPAETYDIQQKQQQQLYQQHQLQQQGNTFHPEPLPLPVTFDSNQIKVEPIKVNPVKVQLYSQDDQEEDTKAIFELHTVAKSTRLTHRRQTSLSSMSSPSSCFSSVSSFIEEASSISSTTVTTSRPTSLYQCEYKGCTKTFTRTYNLKSHRRTHTDEKPFACNVCPKAFARQHDRNRHAKLHLGLKPYLCQFCDKSFARQDALNRHLKRDKKGNVISKEKKNGSSNGFDFPPPCLLIKLRQKTMAGMKKKK